jgi:protein phosphatase
MITAAAVTHPGRVRTINEDAFLCEPEKGLFVVADGMGGHHAGEVASTLAIETVRTFLTRTRDAESVTWPYGIDPDLSFHSNRMKTAVKLANRRVFKEGESREDYTGMGTTLVAAVVDDQRLVVASVGDSRLYAFADDALVQLTEDDTWVRMTGVVDAAQVASHPMKHVLTNVIGAREAIEFGVREDVLNGERTLLLSTDGLHGVLDGAFIASVLRTDGPPESLAGQLVQAALDGGSIDNITALVVRYRP